MHRKYLHNKPIRLGLALCSILLLLFTIAPLSYAQWGFDNEQDNASSKPSYKDIKVSTQWAPHTPDNTPEQDLIITIHMPEKFHINTQNPPDPMLIPTSIIAEMAPNRYRIKQIKYPESKPYQMELFDEPLPVFHGDAEFIVTLERGPELTNDTPVIITVEWQACDDRNCFPPQNQKITLSPPETWLNAPSYDPDELLQNNINTTTNTQQVTTAPAPLAAASDGAASFTFLGMQLFETSSLIVILVMAFIAGFLLNLTPCVLPVIPIKVMSLVKHGGSKGRSIILGIYFSLGIVLTFVVLSLPLVLFSSMWGQMFGYWYVNAILGAFLILMAFSLFGLWEIRLPGVLYKYEPRADTIHGSFMLGILTTVLASPCIGPMFGGILGAMPTLNTNAQGSVEWSSLMTQLGPILLKGILPFVFVGAGMAAPYLILLFKVEWIEKIPQSGPLGDIIKKSMGLLIIAVSIFFLYNAYNVLPEVFQGTLHWWLISFILMGMGTWLFYACFNQLKSGFGRYALPILIIPVTAGMLLFTIQMTDIEREKIKQVAESNRIESEKQAAAAQIIARIQSDPKFRADSDIRKLLAQLDILDQQDNSVWRPYIPAQFEAAKSQGKIVVIEFTADWCTNCKVLEARVLRQPQVIKALQADNVSSFVADLSVPYSEDASSAPGWEKLFEFGTSGLPFTAIIHPDGRVITFDSLFTVNALLNAINSGSSEESEPKLSAH